MNDILLLFNYIIYSLLTCFIIDYSLILTTGTKVRWFKLHGCYNMVMVGLTIDNILKMIQNPYSGFDIINTDMAAIFALMIHIYHCIMFKLKPIDYWHHSISVFFPIILIPNIPKCRYNCVYYFIGTGLPGGLEYFSLVFNKYHYITRYQQKKISAYLNSYIRMPGGILACAYIYLNSFNIDLMHQRYCMYMLTFIIYSNVTYFGKMSIENYGENMYLKDKET